MRGTEEQWAQMAKIAAVLKALARIRRDWPEGYPVSEAAENVAAEMFRYAVKQLEEMED